MGGKLWSPNYEDGLGLRSPFNRVGETVFGAAGFFQIYSEFDPLCFGDGQYILISSWHGICHNKQLFCFAVKRTFC